MRSFAFLSQETSPVVWKVSVFRRCENVCMAVRGKARDSVKGAEGGPAIHRSMLWKRMFPLSHESLMTPGRSGSRNSRRQLGRKWDRRLVGPASSDASVPTRDELPRRVELVKSSVRISNHCNGQLRLSTHQGRIRRAASLSIALHSVAYGHVFYINLGIRWPMRFKCQVNVGGQQFLCIICVRIIYIKLKNSHINNWVAGIIIMA